MTTDLDQEKRRLRAGAEARRAAAAAATEEAGNAVSARLLDAVRLPRDAVVSAYWPMRCELDPRPLMHALHAAGHAISLPDMPGMGQPLVFRAWAPGDVLVSAKFDTQVPAADKSEMTPRVMLVPLLAFDRDGYRLGYGGGFYDRTLTALRAAGPVLAIGLAYAAQEVPAVPRDANDRRLDWIVTEAEAIRMEP
jgi:5-formyltetrahydrofolate cyclo-ligase